MLGGNNTAWLVIGNIPSARVSGFLRALPCDDGSVVSSVSYQSLLSGPRRVMGETLSRFKSCNALRVRLEAPGENTAVLNGLIAHGYAVSNSGAVAGLAIKGAEHNPRFQNLACLHGELKHIDFQFVGFQWLLQQVHASLQAFGEKYGVEVCYMNSPQVINAMSDKWCCQQRLVQAGVRIPRLLGLVQNMQQLCELMCANNMWRVFLKPRYGSSASGVAALQVHPSGKWLSLSGSIEVCTKTQQLYNSLKIRRYTDADLIAYIVNQLCRNQVYAEQWIPKPRLGNKVYDIRAVCLRSVAEYVVRSSASPLTNMHLGNSKHALAVLGLSSLQRRALDCMVQQVAACFPNALYMGIDALLPRGSTAPLVLEVNAFGDQVAGDLSQGERMYARQIAAMESMSSSNLKEAHARTES